MRRPTLPYPSKDGSPIRHNERTVSVLVTPSSFGAWRLRRVGRNLIDLRRLLAVAAGVLSLVIDIVFWADFAPEFTRVGRFLAVIGYGPVLGLPPLIAIIAGAQLLREHLKDEASQRTEEDTNPTVITLRLGAGRSRVDLVWETLTVLYLGTFALTTALFFYAQVSDRSHGWVLNEWTPPLTHHLPVTVALSSVVLTFGWCVTYALVVTPIHIVLCSQSLTHISSTALVSVTHWLSRDLILLGLAMWLLHQSSMLDRSERAHWQETDRLVDRHASSLARQRANDFIHDHVLSALAPVIAGVRDREQLRRAASVAKAALTMSVTKKGSRRVSDVFSSIRTQVEAMGVPIRCHILVTEDFLLPGLVATALTDSTIEALSNSLKHAFPAGSSRPSDEVKRWVDLEASHGRVRIVVGDNGAGFDLASINRTRHGLQHSLISRIEDVGGRVGLLTAPGFGTIAELGWFEKAPVCTPLESWPEIQRQSGAAGLDGGIRSLPTRPAHPVHALTTPKRSGRSSAEEDTRPSALDAIPWQEPFSAAIEKRTTHLLVLFALLDHLLCLVVHLEIYTLGFVAWISFGVMVGCAIALVWPLKKRRMASQAGYEIALAACLANMLLFTVIPTGSTLGWEAWSIPATTLVSIGLLIRGRPGPAWLVQGMTVVTAAAWLLQGGLPLTLLLTTNGVHVLSVILWSLVARTAQRASQATRLQMRRSQLRTARNRIEEEVAQVMHTTLSSVSHRVDPVLDAIIGDGELTPALVTQAMLVEAELRDGIRAQFFIGTQVTVSARKARARGVDLILLDDNRGAHIPEGVRRRVLEYVVVTLDTTTSGNVVVRLLPPGRPFLLTITRDSQSVLRLDHEGLPTT